MTKEKLFLLIGATDKLFTLVEEISKKNIDDVLIFFKSDQLDKKSKIRNLFEKQKKMACVACYKR